jgi:hypothetical protein
LTSRKRPETDPSSGDQIDFAGQASFSLTARQQNRELLTTVTGDEVVASKHGFAFLHKAFQNSIAHKMAMGIIDEFEIIQITHHERKRVPDDMTTLNHPLHLAVKRHPVGRAGNGIHLRGILDLFHAGAQDRNLLGKRINPAGIKFFEGKHQ